MLPVSIVYEKLLAKDCVLVDVLGVYNQVPGGCLCFMTLCSCLKDRVAFQIINPALNFPSLFRGTNRVKPVQTYCF